MRKFLLSTVSVGIIATPALAEVSDGKVKIGILNDQSGVYADFGGKYSYEAAKMAVEDFGGKGGNHGLQRVGPQRGKHGARTHR